MATKIALDGIGGPVVAGDHLRHDMPNNLTQWSDRAQFTRLAEDKSKRHENKKGLCRRI